VFEWQPAQLQKYVLDVAGILPAFMPAVGLGWQHCPGLAVPQWYTAWFHIWNHTPCYELSHQAPHKADQSRAVIAATPQLVNQRQLQLSAVILQTTPNHNTPKQTEPDEPCRHAGQGPGTACTAPCSVPSNSSGSWTCCNSPVTSSRCHPTCSPCLSRLMRPYFPVATVYPFATQLHDVPGPPGLLLCLL
jgi:hypothetical protein